MTWIEEEDNADLGYISHFDPERKIWLDISVNVEPKPEMDESGHHFSAGEIYIERTEDEVESEDTPLNWIAA